MKKGFTLSEVLITLAMIGIIAAISIPSVITNVQQLEFKTGLKKAISALNSSISMNKAIEGESPYDNADLFDYLQRHMSVLKSTNILPWRPGTRAGAGGFYGTLNAAFYTTDGIRYEFISIHHGGYIQGTPLKLHESGIQACHATQKYNIYGWQKDGGFSTCDGCGSYGLANNPNGTTKPPCAITVDVNGDRKPSPAINSAPPKGLSYVPVSSYEYPDPSTGRLGDVFTVLITEDKAIPYGTAAQKAMYGQNN